MSDAAQAVVPKRLFDRSKAGTRTSPVTVAVERDRIRFLSKVLGITDPVHHDVAAARAAGYPDLLAPPSFPMVVEAMANDERERRGQPNLFDLIRCDFRRLLHGGETYTYHGQIFAGDEVEFVTEIRGFQDKKGGALEIAEVALSLSHAERGLLVTADRILIHRLA